MCEVKIEELTGHGQGSFLCVDCVVPIQSMPLPLMHGSYRPEEGRQVNKDSIHSVNMY